MTTQRHWGLSSLSACALALALGMEQSAQAVSPFKVPPRKERYTYEEGCSSDVDPINVVFYGRAGDADNVKNVVNDVMDWNPPAGVVRGSTQYMSIRGRCNKNNEQAASTSELGDRYHLRLFEKRLTRRLVLSYADAHFDIGRACNAVKDATQDRIGFNKGRDQIVNGFRRDGARIKMIRFGNTRPQPQCDGAEAASDGRTAYILVNRRRD